MPSSITDEQQEEGLGKLQAPADFDGPTRNRHCTDILFALLLVSCWTFMTFIGRWAIQNGDYRVVLYPMDYDGNICGTNYGSIDMTAYPKLIYINRFSGGVCAASCPRSTNDTVVDVHTLVTYGGIYRDADAAILPADHVHIADYSSSEDVIYCTNETCPTDPMYSWFSTGINHGLGFAFYATDTYEVFHRCLTTPKAAALLREQVNIPEEDILNVTLVDAVKDGYSNLAADLWTTKKFILGFGFCLSLVIGFVYLYLIRLPAILPIMVWGSLFAMVGIFSFAGLYMVSLSNRYASEDPQIQSNQRIRALKGGGAVSLACASLIFLLTVFFRKQIQIAMGCVKEAGKAVAAMPVLMFFPILQCVGFIAFLSIWMSYGCYLGSMGEVVQKELPLSALVTVRTFQYSDQIYAYGWYLLFCFFWTCAFIVAMGDIIIAMCVAKWYFTRNRSSLGLGIPTLFFSILCSVFYHSGTAAFGSLILAIVRIIQTIVYKLQNKARQMNSNVGEALLCCCQCCLCCFDKCIKFLNKNAYIQTAISGTSFCISARNAFYLIFRNAARVSSIAFVSEVVLLVGRLLITSATGALSYILMNERVGDQVYSLVGPTTFVVLLAYFVSGMFLSVFDMSISTILYCFVSDEEMFSGDECYAQGALRKWIDTSATEQQQPLKK